MKQNIIDNPTILAIDSSNGTCSVAILKNNGITGYYEEAITSMQAKKLLLMVEQTLAASGLSYNDLDLIACTVGPGSFTGIRIGLAAARAIGFAAGKPVIGYNSLKVMAFGSKSTGETITSLNAGKGEVVYQKFDEELNDLCAPTLISQSEAPESASKEKFPRADTLAKLAFTYPGHSVKAVPFYVRPPDAKLPENPNV